MEAPFFSVVIPTYNREVLIVEAITTVLAQTERDFEIIIVDNGSTDNTGSVVHSYTQRDTNTAIRYHRREMGSGSPAAPRNDGIDLACGRWIAFLDSDDIWREDKLARCRKRIETNLENSPDFLTHWQYIRAFGGEKFAPFRPILPSADCYRYLLETENPFATSSVLVRRQFLNEHQLRFDPSERLFAVEDYDLWMRVALSGGKLDVIQEYLGTNQLHDEGMGTKGLLFTNLRALFEHHADNVQQFTNKKQQLKNRLSTNLLLMQAFSSLRNGQVLISTRLLIRALSTSPMQIIRYVLHRLYMRRRLARTR